MSTAPLLVFADDWGRHPSSAQHLVRRLLPRRRVVWVNTIGTRKPRLDLMTLKRGFEKLRQWARPRPAAEPLPPNLTVANPRMWPWFSRPWDRALNRRLLARQLGPVIAELPEPPVAITTLPLTADLIGPLPVRRWVYYCVDDFTVWPGLDGDTLRMMEARLVAKADRIIAVSDTLRDRLATMGRPAELLTHGVDLEFWQASSPEGAQFDSPGRSPGCSDRAGPEDPGLRPGLSNCAPSGLKTAEVVAQPLIVFWGVIDRRMDTEFVRRLAAAGLGQVLLVGPQNDPDPELLKLPVSVAPPLPLAELPALARQASVLVMPYADLPVTRAIQPLKLKEYLATGLPVVVRDLPANRDWADCLDLARTPDEFVDAVRRRLADGLPEAQRVTRKRLDAEGWTEKARLFEQWIDS